MSGSTISEQLERIAELLSGAAVPGLQLERPRNPEHGDLATNIALVLAKRLNKPPREVAQTVIQKLDLPAAGMKSAEIAGPGFINFRQAPGLIQSGLTDILAADDGYGRVQAEAGRRVMVEFVSANPTGPLHVAHGRGAALGDAIASLLEHTGHDVTREFYVNDAGVQMVRLGESLDARWRALHGEDVQIPEGGYHGAYLKDLAAEVNQVAGDHLAQLTAEDRIQYLRDWAAERLRLQQDADLRQFGVIFDSYYFETRLYAENKNEETLQDLKTRGLTYEQDGALWLRTSTFGDDKDRVLVKSDGTYTYFLPDLAYHRDKARRGFDHVINIWGADHHGYVPRIKAGLAALGYTDFLDVEIVQMVRLMRGGAEVKFSKRAGEFVSLRELYEETGVDVARYFFLMRRGDTQMLFDLDLALDQSEKNPVYKVQYAHARMMSIFRKAEVSPDAVAPNGARLELLEHSTEVELIKQLSIYPQVVERAAEARAPHLICDYLETTAGMVNSWYHAGNPNRNPALAVLVNDTPLRMARLALARAIQIVLRNGLNLLGLTAPDRMLREESI
ncbi:MAG TPA: arginine--tRNA ligase [Longimicrobiales bacterium]|nr:arginine--tRNA ligase [Longimicrobiales bacterium]